MTDGDEIPLLQQGVNVIRDAVKKLPLTPGVYRMLSDKGDVLYVGKAKALKKRVSSYIHVQKLPHRLQRMVSQTRSMEFIYTQTEVEALLLESNLIKKLRPKYNILLRDDKSFAFIYVSSLKDYPQIFKHRGAKKDRGKYFGPFASSGAVNPTIQALQRAFLIRNCTDSYFAARRRPCLQYHIKRCSAPCVGKISPQEYQDHVKGAIDFLSGRSQEVQNDLAEKMQAASDEMEFETAAQYRDRLRALAAIQSRQDINMQHIQDADVIGLAQEGGATCVQVFFFRSGRNYGNQSFFPSHDKDDSPQDILAAFLVQFYENKIPPKDVLLPFEYEGMGDSDLIEKALEDCAQSRVYLRFPKRGDGRRAMDFAQDNARDALKRHLSDKKSQKAILQEVMRIFDLQSLPQRIEVYDNSHTGGEQMVGGMIVATPDGFFKNAYRKFNIREAGKSDDYAMMREVIRRRFSRAIKEGDMDENWPSLILIDGGQGQLSAVIEVLEELNILDQVPVAAISKGPDRNAGREIIHLPGQDPVMLDHNDPVLYYLQNIRDEAHRFAIGTHRARRQKNLIASPLDDVPGIGAARKKALLQYFGSAREVKHAGVDDLQKVEGVSRAVAQKIYDYFHEK